VSFKLIILGSSGALPAYGRTPTSQYLTIQNRHFLIDCGEGTQMKLSEYQVPGHKIDHIFISHLHGDHYLGLMGLLFSMHLQRRTRELHLYSQKGLDEIILLQLKYSRTVLNYEIKFHLFDANKISLIHEDDVLTIHTIPLYHKLSCAGFLFREKVKPRRIDKDILPPGIKLQHIPQLKSGLDITDDNGEVLYKNKDYTMPPKASLSYAFCSDTGFYEELIPQIQNVDLLYHEATFMESEKEKAKETKHSTAAEAATIAFKANVKKLVIGHFSARYIDLEPLLKEAQEIFPNTELAIEGSKFELHDTNT
jgi:ribonuclease Z